MNSANRHRLCSMLSIVALATSAGSLAAQSTPAVTVTPSSMKKIGTVDPRFLSYNIEMVEITGGRFWKPYRDQTQTPAAAPTSAPHDAAAMRAAMANLYEYRPPVDLSNPRLRALAKELGPVYLRVSGTWRNSTYFQDNDDPALKEAPKGFGSVLTRAEWKGVVDFSHAIGAKVVTSVAVSAGTRNADGVWQPDQAKRFFAYDRRIGGSIAATEYMNEPTFAAMGGAGAGYNAADFGRDARIFDTFLRKASPHTLYLGPGSVGEGISLGPPGMSIRLISTESMMQATGPIFDAFSYHFYGGVSRRCGGHPAVTPEGSLLPDWLDRTDKVEAFYAGMRDRYLPGKPMWLTEVAEAACGGDTLAGQFVDTVRFLNQLGSLAQRGVQVVMHNTLNASDYGLLDEQTLDPRPDYWAAVLWNRTMGTTVLDPGVPADESVRVYAQCMKGRRGGVTLVALNTDAANEQGLALPVGGERYTLTAPSLTSTATALNGTALEASPDGSLPAMRGQLVKAGTLQLPPASVTFLTLPSAQNAACR